MLYSVFRVLSSVRLVNNKKSYIASSEALGPLSYFWGSLGLSGLWLRKSVLSSELCETIWGSLPQSLWLRASSLIDSCLIYWVRGCNLSTKLCLLSAELCVLSAEF